MRSIRVDVDTSVFGGTEDAEFSDVSRRFFSEVLAGRYIVLISRLVLDELAAAPAAVGRIVEDLPHGRTESVETTEEMEDLADAYIEAGVVIGNYRADALRAATATVACASLILSWNYKHIVNFQRIQRFNAVNLANGYGLVDIRSPLELEYGAGEQD